MENNNMDSAKTLVAEQDFKTTHEALNKYYAVRREFLEYNGRVFEKDSKPEDKQYTEKFKALLEKVKQAKKEADIAREVEKPYFDCYYRFLEQAKEGYFRDTFVSSDGIFIEIPMEFFDTYTFPDTFHMIYCLQKSIKSGTALSCQ
jgi:hypothetical protein